MLLQHPIPPFWAADSKILILGSFPSVKSREQGFPYGHPQNRFWRVLAALWQTEVPATVAAKKQFLLERQIALWDVIASCEIQGSADASIKNASPNDLSPILAGAPVQKIFVNGNTAAQLYKRHIQNQIGVAAHVLPSTSPANAAYNLEKLVLAWQIILKCV